MSAFVSATPILHRRSTLIHTSLDARRPLPHSTPRSAHFHPRIRVSPIAMSAANPSNLPANLPSPDAPAKPTLPQPYKRIRTTIFLTMLVSYAVNYLTRSTFPFIAPLLQTSHNLSLQQIGLISSCFPAAYGVSKLLAGILSDLRPPRTIIVVGLLFAAITNLVFMVASSVPQFAALWALTGVAASLGFPACAKLLTNWYTPAERGTYWGMLNISLNLGASVAPVVIASTATRYGWRAGILLPAALALIMAVVASQTIVNTPQDAKLPPTNLLPKPSPKPKTGGKNGSAILEQLKGGVAREPAIWLLAASYFFVYIVRQALSSWAVFYLLQARGVANLAEAGLRVSGLEIGGLLGSLSAGYVSDVLIRKYPNAGAIGLRIRVILAYVVITALAGLSFFNAGTAPLQWATFAMTGFGLYGPQLLVGLCGAECVERRYAGTSNGFVGLVSYAGATLAGLPLSMAVKRFGWGALPAVVVGCCAIVGLLLLPLVRKRSHEQNHEAALAKST